MVLTICIVLLLMLVTLAYIFENLLPALLCGPVLIVILWEANILPKQKILDLGLSTFWTMVSVGFVFLFLAALGFYMDLYSLRKRK